MVTRETVATAARDFLKAVAETTRDKLGPHPKYLQHSMWMVHGEHGGMTSKEFKRKVFHRGLAFHAYLNMRDDLLQRQRLEAVLARAGIPIAEMQHSIFSPLVRHWLELPDPFACDEIALSEVLDEFADAVVNSELVARSRVAIERFDLSTSPVVFQEGVSIRPIGENELWEFGESYLLQPIGSFQTRHMPSEDWKILDIELRHVREDRFPPTTLEAVREAALVALRLASPGSLQVVDLGSQASYGMGAIGRLYSIGLMPRELGRFGGTYVLDEHVTRRLKECWPRLRKIMESESHYLRLPALRLVDGGRRDRADDALVDYAIGLEALLTEGIKDELRYRLALRGATILAWDSGNKKRLYEELRQFYDVRSSVVHGSHVERTRLDQARSAGEKALRDIWWWYFANGAAGLKKAISIVDSRILE